MIYMYQPTHPPTHTYSPSPLSQLTEKIHKAGLRVVRLAARTRESVTSSVDHLCLHSMVRALVSPDKAELRKLQQLKEELGELVRACVGLGGGGGVCPVVWQAVFVFVFVWMWMNHQFKNNQTTNQPK